MNYLHIKKSGTRIWFRTFCISMDLKGSFRKRAAPLGFYRKNPYLLEKSIFQEIVEHLRIILERIACAEALKGRDPDQR